MKTNFSLLARAAAGDPYAREEAAPLIWRALDGYFRLNGALPLERFLQLPTGGARREIYLHRRNYWLTMAHALCEGDTPWKKSVRLAEEIERFLTFIWPAWEGLEMPPEGASQLRCALFSAMHNASQIQTDKGLPAMPATARMLHEIVKRKGDEISQGHGEDEGSETP